MKVYFIASISGQSEYGQNYKLIYDSLINLGVEVLSDHVLTANSQQLQQVSPDQEKKFYKQLNSWINQADCIVAEVSYPSTSVGHEVTLAISKNKPVILLHVPEKKPVLFEGVDDTSLQMIQYHPDNIESELKMALEFASTNQDTRFNFFISPKHQHYLDWIAKNKRIPRSVFLRRLIEQHMAANDEYQG